MELEARPRIECEHVGFLKSHLPIHVRNSVASVARMRVSGSPGKETSIPYEEGDHSV